MIVQTVLGQLDPRDLGITMPHEHFFADSSDANFEELDDPELKRLAEHPVDLQIRGWLEQHWHRNRDNLILDDEDIAIAEARRYREAGGRSIIDVTPRGIARNPRGLANIAESAGINIIMGCGYYVEATHPPELHTLSREEIATQIISEFAEGADGTGVQPGVIGEIGCSWPLAEAEKRVLRGAAAAQLVLGAALYVHPGRHPEAPEEIIELLVASGVDTRRIVICHVERTVPASELDKLAQTGCFIEFDLFGMEMTGSYFKKLGITLPSDAERLNWIRKLIDDGYGEQVLISQDICFKHRLARYGGHGYDHIVANIVPWMHSRGFTAQEVETIVAKNPQQVASLPTRDAQQATAVQNGSLS